MGSFYDSSDDIYFVAITTVKNYKRTMSDADSIQL